MKPVDIVKLYADQYPAFENDYKIANQFFTKFDYDHAGEKFKVIGRELLKIKLYSVAADFYTLASDNFKTAKKYEKCVATELTLFEIYKITGNSVEMASAYEKAASYYRYFLNEPVVAAKYYLICAKIHEDNQNYRSAFKKALFATLCLEDTHDRATKKDANSLACRMAMQSGYYEKAGIHAKKWLDLMDRNFNAHYISICVKGYTAFAYTERKVDALFFLNEIITAHYSNGEQQTAIKNHLMKAQKLYIEIHQDDNKDYQSKMTTLLVTEQESLIRYYIDLKNFANQCGLGDLADRLYIQEQDLRREDARSKNIINYIGYSAWKISCNYGTSFSKWLITTIIVIIIFGFLYMPCGYRFENQTLNQVLAIMKPSIKSTGAQSWFSPFYYSVVTIATLGYGDVIPTDTSGQIFSVLEVLTGYLTFGGLLSVFSKKFTR
jgi:hypothetical protein